MSQEIINFLKLHPLIKISALERICNVPQSIIDKAVKGTRPLNYKYHKKIIQELEKYGF